MVDVIRFYIDNLSMNENILKTKFKTIHNTEELTTYRYDFHNSELFSDRKKNIEKEQGDPDKVKSYKRSYHYIFFTIKKKENPKKIGKLIFNQNIRRNWIDYITILDKKGIDYTNIQPIKPLMPRFMADLSYSNFINIIDLYSEELKIPKNIFWNAKVTQVELGANLKFSTKIKTKKGVERLSLEGMLSSFGSLKNVPEKDTYGRSGVRFKADAFEISIYDKMKRVIFTEEFLKNVKDSIKESRRKKFNKINRFFRYELRVKEVSSFRRERALLTN